MRIAFDLFSPTLATGSMPDSMIRRNGDSLRDSMLKKPIIGETTPSNGDESNNKSLVEKDDSPFSKLNPGDDSSRKKDIGRDLTRRDETLDLNDDEKRREIERGGFKGDLTI